MEVKRKSPRRTRKKAGAEGLFVFKIDAYTPKTIPMSRLAQYMGALAGFLGETPFVHFERLVPGSTGLAHRVENEAIPKVLARTSAIRTGVAETIVLDEFRKINTMLREDNASAAYQKEGYKRNVLTFPGITETLPKNLIVRQRSFLIGTLVRVGGTDATIHATLQTDDKRTIRCVTSKLIGKRLASHLFDPVKLFGLGKWCRGPYGQWEVMDFKIESFEEIDDAPLSKIIADLRAIPSDWADNTLRDLELLRNGEWQEGDGIN